MLTAGTGECVCKNGDPQVLDKLFEKKLLPGVKNLNITTIFCHFMLALCTFLKKIIIA